MSGNGIINIDIEKIFSNEEKDFKKNSWVFTHQITCKIYKFSRCYQ